MSESVDYKRAAIEQWTADPCGANESEGEPGTLPYLEQLLVAREAYAPWMSDILDYAHSTGLRVLDVGCGQGIDLIRYAQAGAIITGVDLTPKHVELARTHLDLLGLSGTIVEGDAEALPFEDASFDRVSSNGVLHHTPGIGAALREIRRVLAPGGEARVILYNRGSFHYWLHQVLWQGVLCGGLVRERSMAGVLSRGVEVSSIDARPLVRVYSRGDVRRLFHEAGFDDVGVAVRHFLPSDTPVTQILRRFVPALEDPAVQDRIGRLGGWYVIGRGVRPGRPA